MTPDFERILRDRGAVLEPFQGVVLPSCFGDIGREWRAAREGGAVFAAGFRSHLIASGEDRAVFLQGMLSNDVKALGPGQGVYAALLDQQGKIVSDLRVYAEADRLRLDIVSWRCAAVREALERFIVADDVELATPDDEMPLLGIEGPFAHAIAAEALGLGDLPRTPYAHARTTFESAPVLAVTVSEVDGSGVLVCGPPRCAGPLFDACIEAGARPLGMQALDVLRVEAGVPWAGIDMDETVLMMETGRESALSFTKGCYLGQEVVERIAARGHVNRHLMGLLIDGATVPVPRDRLVADGRAVGYVTSAVRSQWLERPIALAMVQRTHTTPGARVEVKSGGTGIRATVSALPFTASTSE
jgi:folate-binding protein YgfZ